METLVSDLLAEQRSLAGADRFSSWHEQRHAPVTPAERYRHLLPLSEPRPGEQYAFEVDLDACSGCKACVTACHSLNGLEERESWRSVGLLVDRSGLSTAASPARAPVHPRVVGDRLPLLPAPGFLRHVTTACHHCAEPACLHGCPVLAYEKDPATGIVRHLDDQCIGCSYCTLMCPYEVPKYSPRLGIVRKCDLCHGRLEVGEAPACAQACPNSAIRIGVVPTEHVRERHGSSDLAERTAGFLPGAPDPRLTLPTTRYLSRSPLPAQLEPADAGTVAPAPAHTPLAVMLVLTQAAAGAFIAQAIGQAMAWNVSPAWARLGWALLAAGLAVSVLHLGQPRKAWRAFLGWRRSWLSREILVFGAFFNAATLQLLPSPVAGTVSAGVTASLGLLGVFASARVYIVTGRPCWSGTRTAGRFFGTTALAAAGFHALAHPSRAAWLFLIIMAGLKLAGEAVGLRSAVPAVQRTARLQRGALRRQHQCRLACAGLGLALAGMATLGNPGGWGLAAALALLAGEFLERSLFFRTAAPDRKPPHESGAQDA